MAVRKAAFGQRELRERDVIREAMRLRGASPDKLARSVDDLNAYVIGSATAGIKMRNPGMTKVELSAELRRTFE